MADKIIQKENKKVGEIELSIISKLITKQNKL